MRAPGVVASSATVDESAISIGVRSWKAPARRQGDCTRARFEGDIASVDLVQDETATRLGATVSFVTCSLAFQRRTLPFRVHNPGALHPAVRAQARRLAATQKSRSLLSLCLIFIVISHRVMQALQACQPGVFTTISDAQRAGGRGVSSRFIAAHDASQAPRLHSCPRADFAPPMPRPLYPRMEKATGFLCLWEIIHDAPEVPVWQVSRLALNRSTRFP